MISDNPAPLEVKQTGRACVRAFRGLQENWSEELEVNLYEGAHAASKLFGKIWTAAHDLDVEARRWPLDEGEVLEFDEAIDEVVYFWFVLSYVLVVSEDDDWDESTRALVGDIGAAIHDQTVIDRCIRRWSWICSVFVSCYASTPVDFADALINSARLHRVLVATGLEVDWLPPAHLNELAVAAADPAAARERVFMELVFAGCDALLTGVVSYEANDRVRTQLSGLWLGALLIQAQEFGAARADRLSALAD